jgi:nitrogen fixation NifU-like protein
MEPKNKYSQTFLKHFKNPKNTGRLNDASTTGYSANPICGDTLELFLKINKKKIIEKATFLSNGCPATIAVASITTEMIIGKTIASVLLITKHDIAKAIGGLPKSKNHSSVIAEDAIKTAINSWNT